mgnify:CR=1 FL=1
MRNYDIIKKVFEMTRIGKDVKYWQREELAEKKLKEIQGLIANERPSITGPKWEQEEAGVDY